MQLAAKEWWSPCENADRIDNLHYLARNNRIELRTKPLFTL